MCSYIHIPTLALNKSLSKSNWELTLLTENQIAYAALDVLVSIVILGPDLLHRRPYETSTSSKRRRQNTVKSTPEFLSVGSICMARSNMHRDGEFYAANITGIDHSRQSVSVCFLDDGAQVGDISIASDIQKLYPDSLLGAKYSRSNSS